MSPRRLMLRQLDNTWLKYSFNRPESENLTQYFEHHLVSSYASHSVEKGAAIIQISYQWGIVKSHASEFLNASSSREINFSQDQH